MQRINGDNCPIQRPYDLFRAILQLASDDCVQALRQHIGNLNTRLLEDVCSEEVVRRTRARHEADLKASAETAAQGR